MTWSMAESFPLLEYLQQTPKASTESIIKYPYPILGNSFDKNMYDKYSLCYFLYDVLASQLALPRKSYEKEHRK
jgi:hypothetical protein